ncbi:hypothetical protein CJ481_15930 [Bacillus subtilis]|nr:hypothetical protein CJ481_15930 [Bacillus subtilis]
MKNQDKRSVLFEIGRVDLNIFIWVAMFIAIFGGSYAGYRRNRKRTFAIFKELTMTYLIVKI